MSLTIATLVLFISSTWADNFNDLILNNIDFDFHNPEAHLSFANEPTLLRGSKHSEDLQCLRLYAGRKFTGAWSDMCSSNELLSHFNIFHTASVCAPKDNFWQKKRFWLLFAEPGFRGDYILLSEKECVRNLERVGLSTLGSVLQCTMDSAVGKPTVRCTFPAKPWREFQAISTSEARKAVEQAVQLQSRVSAVSLQTGGENPETKFSLADLQNLKNQAMNKAKDEN